MAQKNIVQNSRSGEQSVIKKGSKLDPFNVTLSSSDLRPYNPVQCGEQLYLVWLFSIPERNQVNYP